MTGEGDLVMMEEKEEIASPREEHRGSPSREHWSKPMTLTLVRLRKDMGVNNDKMRGGLENRPGTCRPSMQVRILASTQHECPA
jgi:hypothetical protein